MAEKPEPTRTGIPTQQWLAEVEWELAERAKANAKGEKDPLWREFWEGEAARRAKKQREIEARYGPQVAKRCCESTRGVERFVPIVAVGILTVLLAAGVLLGLYGHWHGGDVIILSIPPPIFWR